MDLFLRPGTEAHRSILHHCVEPDDEPVLLARWGRGLLLLTRRRLVVTRTSLLHRAQLHLNATFRHLSNISFSVEDQALVVSLTAVDGIRERFVLRLADPSAAEARFRDVVHPRSQAVAAAA